MNERVWIQQHPGHALIPARHGRNLCDLCGTKGTDFRCSAGCDYDVCGKCCESAMGSSTAKEAKPGWAPQDSRSERPEQADQASISAEQRDDNDASGDDSAVEPTPAESWLDAAASSKAQMGDGADGEEDPATRSESSADNNLSWQEELAGYAAIPADVPLELPPMPKMFAATAPACAGDAAAGHGASARMPLPPQVPHGAQAGQPWWDPASAAWGLHPPPPGQRRRGVSAPHGQQHPQQWQAGSQMWLSGSQWMQGPWSPDSGFGPGATASGFGSPAPHVPSQNPAPQVHSL